ncbi:hypothetical protein HY448_00070 [Candidatus Pacearchaeota archaeon]|nr:hypothetical protein [Candidatus Pacearchaeota archaeon]
MKHKIKITFILVFMFVVAQLIGIYVVNHYSSHELPLGFQIPDIEEEKHFNELLFSMVLGFTFIIILVFFLMKFNVEFILRLWFFSVVAIALFLSFNVFVTEKIIPWSIFELPLSLVILSAIVAVLAYIKIYKRNYLIHNLTELFVYPGIAAVFVQFLNIKTMIALLVLISVYDIWAVNKSGIMQKMANYQIKKLNVFSGFFVPYISKSLKLKLQKMKTSSNSTKSKKIRVNVAVLGGGDVVFPIIASGVMLKTLGLYPALLVALGATLGFLYLLIFSEKKKFYPAMPFISAGIIAAMIISYLIL